MPRASVVLAALALGFAAPGVPGFADDPPSPAIACKSLLAEIAEAKSKPDEARLAAALGKAGATYRAVQEPALREALRKEIAAAIRNEKAPAARAAALKALVDSGDVDHAWKALSPVFPSPEVLLPEPFAFAVVDAAGALCPDGAIASLLVLFEKGVDPKLSAAAVGALGGYRVSRQRVRVLQGIVDGAKKQRPAQGRRGAGDEAALGRWLVVAPAISSALDRLTGRTIGDVAQWIRVVEETKDPKSLFR